MIYPEEFKAYVRELAFKCRYVTNHDEYDLKIKWEPDNDPRDNSHSSTFASIKADSVYLWATISVYPALLEKYEEGDLRGIGESILHELCHLFIEPVDLLYRWDVSSSQRNYFNDTVERQTERICKAIHMRLPDDWFTPKALGLESSASGHPGTIEASEIKTTSSAPENALALQSR